MQGVHVRCEAEATTAMPKASGSAVSAILRRVTEGDQDAAAELFQAVYDELHAVAERCFRHERPDHTLQPTALIHEAYLKLINQPQAQWNDRAHFFAAAAMAMRRILVNHAMAHRAAKRGGGRRRTPLSRVIVAANRQSLDLIALEEALQKLATLDARQSRIVELRFFGGLTNAEAAEVLGISLRTVEGEWAMAKTWLLRQIGENDRDAGTLAGD